MADTKALSELSNSQLKSFAEKHGVDVTGAKGKAELVDKISPAVTPEQLEQFRTENDIKSPEAPGDGNGGGDESDQGGENTTPDTPPAAPEAPETPTGTTAPKQDGDGSSTPVTPNSAPPAPGDTQVVDNSAPGDPNKLAEVKNDKPNADTAAEERTTQPGDPTVKTNEGGVITERDATPADLENVDTRKKPVQVKPEPTPEDEPSDDGDAHGGDSGHVNDDEAEEKDPPVKLKNPSGKVVEVNVEDISKRQLFAAGFQLVKGEKYPKEITDLQKAYGESVKARGLYNDVDQSDPGQSNSRGDVERRAGSKEVGDQDGKPQALVATPKNANKPVAFDGVDKREDGQVVNPQTGKPKSSNRLAQALEK